MSDFEILRQMIRESAIEPITERYGKKSVTLVEPKAPDASVTILGLPDDAIVIKADAFTAPDSIFAGSKGECRRADYVIVAHAGSRNPRKLILYIEMKANQEQENEVIQQLKGARCFVAYCREIGKSFWNRDDFLEGYQARFIGVFRTRLPKRKTRIERQAVIHDRPERLMKISYPGRLEFNHLAGASK